LGGEPLKWQGFDKLSLPISQCVRHSLSWPLLATVVQRLCLKAVSLIPIIMQRNSLTPNHTFTEEQQQLHPAHMTPPAQMKTAS